MDLLGYAQKLTCTKTIFKNCLKTVYTFTGCGNITCVIQKLIKQDLFSSVYLFFTISKFVYETLSGKKDLHKPQLSLSIIAGFS